MTEQESKEIKAELDCRKKLEEIFNSEAFDRMFAEQLTRLVEEDFKYRGAFMRLGGKRDPSI